MKISSKEKLETSYYMLDDLNKRVKEESLSLKKLADGDPESVIRELGDFCSLIDELRRNLSVAKQVLLGAELSLRRLELVRERDEMDKLREEMKLID